jgi:eukaryotic-like serine/threonine-protein kinase
VHRDLKPGNIFLSRGPNDEVEPKLLDFGISKESGGAEKMRLTSTQGLLMGTPLYMSPEALLNTEMTPASDQYSLGVVLYECATGVNPFVSDSVVETARRVTSGLYAPISEQAIRPSRRLQTIIERMMSLDPRDRYRDMRALGQDLLTLAGQRTRITWGLTFGEVARAVRVHHAQELDEEATALARTRASARPPQSSIGPLLAAAAVSVAAVAAVLNWSATRNAPNEAVAAGAAPHEAAVAGAAPHGAVAGAAPHALAESPGPTPPTEAAPAASRELLARESSAAEVAPPSPSATADGAVTESAAAPAPPPRTATPEAASTERPPAPRRAMDRLEAPAPPPDPPEWIIERTKRRSRSAAAPFQIGTNDALIFD